MRRYTNSAVLLVEAGEDPDVVFAEQPPTFSFKRAREKIFAKDMTIEKLSELMGGNDKSRIINWKYVARTKGSYKPPSSSSSSSPGVAAQKIAN